MFIRPSLQHPEEIQTKYWDLPCERKGICSQGGRMGFPLFICVLNIPDIWIIRNTNIQLFSTYKNDSFIWVSFMWVSLIAGRHMSLAHYGRNQNQAHIFGLGHWLKPQNCLPCLDPTPSISASSLLPQPYREIWLQLNLAKNLKYLHLQFLKDC